MIYESYRRACLLMSVYELMSKDDAVSSLLPVVGAGVSGEHNESPERQPLHRK